MNLTASPSAVTWSSITPRSQTNMEEARRASGRKMRDDMRSLESNRLERTFAGTSSKRGSQPAKRGSAWSGGANSSSGGISGDLSETAGRQKYPTQ